MIWIITGVLFVSSGALTLAFEDNAGGEANAAGVRAGKFLRIVIGIVFFKAGLQTTRGTAKDTKGNNIGSIIFGVLVAGVGIIALMGEAFAEIWFFVVLVINLLSGVALIAAGTLALVGRVPYRQWQNYHKGRRASRTD